MTLEDRRSGGARASSGLSGAGGPRPSGVCGFSTFGDFRAWPGYRFTVEHTVHVRADGRSRGTGTPGAGTAAARHRLGKHVMIAGVDAANEASIRFHERLGFTVRAPA